MRRTFTFLFLTAAFMVAAPIRAAEPKALFDGKTLAGWEGDTKKTWHVEDGAIVGGSLDTVVPRNEFLCTTATFGDFDLKVKFKLVGDKKKANAGVQFRTKRIPNHHEVSGYQADAGQGYWGALYDESRRKRVLAQPEKGVAEKIVKQDDWNDYRIRCEGSRIRLWLNGTLTVDYTEKDDKIDRTGIIGLQIHGGAKAKVYYKDITIEQLTTAQGTKKRHYLYVAEPGIRNYLEFGGAGILVFDIDNGHKFVKRIKTPASELKKPENIKGVCASAATKRLYFTTLTKLYCLDLVTEKTLWEKTLPGGCDRMSITPDGKTIYVPSYEKDHWNVVDAMTGELITPIETKNGAHNTVVSRDGTRMYMAGLKSNILPVADTKTHKVIQKVGPFSASIRPFTVNADRSLVVVNVNGLLGFEIGDLNTGKKLYRVEVEGFKQGPTKRHGCPSHGVGMTPDEKEIWVCDAANSRVHIFDATVMPPKQVASVKLREQPGWVTFSGDGRLAWPSTGDVIDVKTRKIVQTLTDEEGREVHSEKIVEIIWVAGVPVWVGDQFGVGRKGAKSGG